MTMSKFIPPMSPHKLSYILLRCTEIFMPSSNIIHFIAEHCLAWKFQSFAKVMKEILIPSFQGNLNLKPVYKMSLAKVL